MQGASYIIAVWPEHDVSEDVFKYESNHAEGLAAAIRAWGERCILPPKCMFCVLVSVYVEFEDAAGSWVTRSTTRTSGATGADMRNHLKAIADLLSQGEN